MMIQKTKETAMPRRIALEGREAPVSSTLARGLLQLDQLDFVSAAGHRIGEPVDGLFDRRASTDSDAHYH